MFLASCNVCRGGCVPMWREACEGMTRVREEEGDQEGDQGDQGVKEAAEEGRERFC